MGIWIVCLMIFFVGSSLWCYYKGRMQEETDQKQTAATLAGPGRELILKYSDSFLQLAQTFREMPAKKEKLSEEEVQDIFGEIEGHICRKCERWGECWKREYYQTYRMMYEMLAAAEEEGELEGAEMAQGFCERCLYVDQMLEEMTQLFHRAKLNLMWSNRMLENRSVIASQLYETACLMDGLASRIYSVEEPDELQKQQIKLKLKIKNVQVREILIQNQEHRKVYLTMRTVRGECISTKEAASILTEVYKTQMTPTPDSKRIINREYGAVLFVEEPAYYMLNGVARATRDGEMISGDNFTFLTKDNGQVIMSLCDGMGSGIGASKESETVIELLEQFLDAGFGMETAVRMINSVMVLREDESIFSTIDLCAVDLYTGMCELLKIGASTTFIRHGDQIEAIRSTSLPVGVMQNVDYEHTQKRLYDGDFIVMVSDGVLDAMPVRRAEEIIGEWILQSQTMNAKEMAEGLLDAILRQRCRRAEDDMTILIGSVWKK